MAERPPPAPAKSSDGTGGETGESLSGERQLPGPSDSVWWPVPLPHVNVEGEAYTGAPVPDPVGDVGPLHYIQAVNQLFGDPASAGSQYVIFDKATGARVAGPLLMEDLADPAGACARGKADPIVLYDHLAGRWLLAEVAEHPLDPPPYHLCLYVSQTSDPVSGGWFAYDIETPRFFPDYPKIGVTPETYFVSTTERILLTDPSPWEPTLYALDREALLAGVDFDPAAHLQRRTIPHFPEFHDYNYITPADLDGPLPPPPGAPGIYVRHRDADLHGPPATEDVLEIWELDVDWADPGSTTLTGPLDVEIGDFDSAFCPPDRLCVPQPSGQAVDALPEIVMWRLQYRNFGGHEALLGNFTTGVEPDGRAGVYWFELRRSPVGVGPWTFFQSGVLAPDDDHRWMGSVAMDGCGNIAVGYSVSGLFTHPSLRYAGRLRADPAGIMGSERSVVGGGGSWRGPRWGDYASMSVDEEDQCTFWFTGEYVPYTGDPDASDWSTRIVSFQLESCEAFVDPDADGVLTCTDNCPGVANTGQADGDGDLVGDACDACADGPPALDGVAFDDGCGSGDGILQRGETILLDVTIRNPGTVALPVLTGTLGAPPDVTVAVATAVFGPAPILPGGTATARFVISIDTSLLCPDPGLAFTVDVSGPQGCATLLAFDLPLLDCTLGGGSLIPPSEVPNTSLRVRKIPTTGLRLDWAATAGASVYNSYRGTLDSLWRDRAYDHQASLALGAGSCDETTVFSEDFNDLISPGDFYYLVTAEAACGLEGPTGFDSLGDPRPAGGGCP